MILIHTLRHQLHNIIQEEEFKNQIDKKSSILYKSQKNMRSRVGESQCSIDVSDQSRVIGTL